jgi:outer membrane protein assembly factor BamD (BamD/ComL family)
MSSTFFLVLIISLVLICVAILVFLWQKQNAHTELYSEGVRNENAGQYEQALHNYEDALNEIRKLRMSKRFGSKIVQRIKVMRTLINYEKAFHRSGQA